MSIENQFEVQEVESLECKDDVSTNTAAVIRTEEYGNSVQLNLQTAGIAVQLNTQSAVSRIVELTSQYEVVSAQFKECTGRLEASFYRIGFLEAKLEEREREIAELKQKLQAESTSA